MPVISGKRAFLEILKQEGVEVMFGNPGTTELPLMDALAVDNEMRYLLGLQEAVVMAMADGYAQASGKLAVVNLHVTPGLGNAMGMLYDAQKAGSPILVTAGQHDQDFNRTEPILYADLPPIARPLVKWSDEVHRLADLPLMVHRAAKTALAPPTGPVFLSLPGDILKNEADLDLLAPTRVATNVRGDRAAIEAAAKVLGEAKRPVIMAGDAVSQNRATAELVALAELLGAPVYAELIPNTASFPTSHPLFRGAMARSQTAMRKIFDQHDVLFSAGADLFALSLPSDVAPISSDLRIVHLDTDPWELGKNYPAEVAILGNPKATLPELTEATRAAMPAAAQRGAKERLKAAGETTKAELEKLKSRAKSLASETPVQPLALIHAISEILPKDAVVIDETVSSSGGLRQLVKSDDPQSYFGLRGGGIGWGLPASIGVKVALPDRPVICLSGDGSAMYTIQSLWTAARYKIGVVFVIFNNTSYRILKQRVFAQRGYAAQLDTYVGMELTNPAIDYVGLARALGIAGHRAKTVHDATDLIAKALDAGTPTLIDVELVREFK
ncbi:MAG TPA: thiamine pyrophosphate-binding protein [Xanthobacteraceae bacterium]|nr:thiamine pyrophosphate-binding protein [Xanthobacteraceae bacterium]